MVSAVDMFEVAEADSTDWVFRSEAIVALESPSRLGSVNAVGLRFQLFGLKIEPFRPDSSGMLLAVATAAVATWASHVFRGWPHRP